MRTGSKHDIKDERIDGGKAFDWSGAGETMHPIEIPACYKEKFELVHHEEFDVLHFAAMAELRKKD